MRYRLQNRFQDSGWEDLGVEFINCGDAICKASELADNAMVRVIDTETNEIVITYAAGGGISH